MIPFLSYRLKAVPNLCILAHWYKPTACFCDFAFPIIAVKFRASGTQLSIYYSIFPNRWQGGRRGFLNIFSEFIDVFNAGILLIKKSAEDYCLRLILYLSEII